MSDGIADQVHPIVADYEPEAPRFTADLLRKLWLQFEPKTI